MLVNGIFLIVPVITWLMGLLDLRHMGFTTPTFFSFCLGNTARGVVYPIELLSYAFCHLEEEHRDTLDRKA